MTFSRRSGIQYIKKRDGFGALGGFAQRIGIAPPHLTRLMAGSHNPRLDLLRQIKAASGGEIADLDDFDMFEEKDAVPVDTQGDPPE